MSIHSMPEQSGALPLDWLVTPASSFKHPNDVLMHPSLTDPERKAILASWASDARAVEGMPWLRKLDDGSTIALDDVLEALRALDLALEPSVARRKRPSFGGILCKKTGRRIPVEYRSCRP